jgi:DNA segregation ATPase FtsK/SpoIIIE-like protein
MTGGDHRESGVSRPARRRKGLRLGLDFLDISSIPVIPPDALFSPRVLGAALAGFGAFTLVALLSPTGLLTAGWAQRAGAIAGWAAGPWAAVLVSGGIAFYVGRRAVRRAILGRIAGATLLLLAAAAVHQLVVDPPAPEETPASVLTRVPGVDGQVGLVFGAALAAWFGVRGATLLLAPLAVAGFGLLCGWSLQAWQRLGHQTLTAAAYVAWGGRYIILAVWWTATVSARAVSRAARTARKRAAGAALRYRAWRMRRAIKAAERAAARAAAEEARRAQAMAAADVAGDELPAVAAGDPLALLEPPAQPPLDPAAQTLDSGMASAGAGTRSSGRSAAVAALPAAPGVDARLAGAPWQLPPTSLLSATTAQQVSEAEFQEKSRIIERTLNAFNVPVAVKEWRVGPTVTQFSLKPAEGVSVKKIKAFEADLQLVLAAKTLRIELPVPGRPVVGIEIPNSGIATVGLREIVEAPQFRNAKAAIRLAFGRDVDGIPRVGDLARMPHLLIAGQTGSGKSGCVNSIIASLLFEHTPDELNLIMIDPKMVEMAEYEGIPHLRYPVVVDLAEAGKVLLWVVEEMERRYKIMAEAGYRNIDSYNKSLATAPRKDPFAPPPKPFPYLVIIIDELADLMMFAPDDVEPAICRLTAKARAVGIHLVVATQRPSVNVVTGLIKANMPSRIAFAVSSQIDSRVILDMAGAETLLGRGDMLYLPYDQGKPIRVQGTWVTDEEISALIHFWKKQGSPDYVKKEEIDALALKQEAHDDEKGDRQSPLMARALAVLATTNYCSISWLQRKLGVGYPRAARLLDELEERGILEADEANGKSYRVVADALAEATVDEP